MKRRSINTQWPVDACDAAGSAGVFAAPGTAARAGRTRDQRMVPMEWSPSTTVVRFTWCGDTE
jgi:hypothetical protein